MLLSSSDSPALIALAAWWNNGEPAEVLDFSHCEPADVQALPRELMRLLQTKMTSLSLPQGLRQSTLPEWLAELKALKQLVVPGYIDEAVDLTTLNPHAEYTIEIGGNSLERIDVSEQAHIPFEPRYQHRQVFVESIDEMPVDTNPSRDLESARVRDALMQWIGNGTPTGTLDFSQCRASAIKQLSPELIRFFQARITSLTLSPALTQVDVPDWLSELKALKQLEIFRCWEPRIQLQHLRPNEPFTLEISDDLVGVSEVHTSDKAVVLLNDKSLDAVVYPYLESGVPRGIEYAMASDVRNALILWWQNGKPRGPLDLSDCNPAHLQRMGSAIRLLQEKITSITLPRSLAQNTLPNWLPALRSLERLEIPRYEDSSINLTHLRPDAALKVELGGDKIRHAHVFGQTDVYCREIQNDKKVRVHTYDDVGNAINIDTAMGYAYFATPNGNLNSESLNDGEAQYEDGTQITCQSISFWEVIGRQKNAAKAAPHRRAEARAAEMGSKELLESMLPNTKKLYTELYHAAPVSYLAGHQEFGQVLAEQFRSMNSQGEGESKQMMLLTPNHAMTVYLRVKETLDGRKRYVMALYDPNVTHMHLRTVEGDLEEIRNWSLDKLLQKEDIDLYYGEGLSGTKTSLLIPVPDNLQAHLDSGEPLFDPSVKENRRVEEFLPAADKADPGRLFHLLSAGLPLPIDDLKKQIAAFSKQEDRITFLTCEIADIAPGFHVAAENGVPRAIKDYGKLLIEVIRDGLLSPTVFKSLVTAKDSMGDSALYLMLQNGHAEAIKEYGKLLIDAHKERLLSPADFKEVVASIDMHNVSALGNAVDNGQGGGIREYGKFLIEAINTKLLLPADFKELVLIKNENGDRPLFAALASADNSVAKEYGRLVLEGARMNYLSNGELMEQLEARDIDGQSGLALALGNVSIETAKEHGGTILRAYGEGLISRTQLDTLEPNPNWLQNNLQTEYLLADVQRDVHQHLTASVANSGQTSASTGNTESTTKPKHNILNELSGLLDSVLNAKADMSFEGSELDLNKPLGAISAALKAYSQPHGDERRRSDQLHLISQEMMNVKRIIPLRSEKEVGQKNSKMQMELNVVGETSQRQFKPGSKKSHRRG